MYLSPRKSDIHQGYRVDKFLCIPKLKSVTVFIAPSYSRVRCTFRSSTFHSLVRLSTIHFEVLFSAAVIAGSIKTCIVIVLEILFKLSHYLVPLTYISHSTDFVKILH